MDQLTPSPSTPPSAPKSVWAALILLAATVIGAGAGTVIWADGGTLGSGVLAGGGAFTGSVLLLIALHRFCTDGRE